MDITLYIALALNLGLVVCELWVLTRVKDKSNVFKYYTFLQNFIALAVSAVFCVFAVRLLALGQEIPMLVKGLRYTASCGLAATMFVFAVILAPRYKSSGGKSGGDIFCGADPKTANLLLHYICPIVSIISFVFFERQTVLRGSEWTGYAAIPSCAYWAIYILLTVTRLWKEPYGLLSAKREKKRSWVGVFFMLAIPAAFIVLSYLLYWANLF